MPVKYSFYPSQITAGRCFRKMLGPKAQIQKCWQALIIRGGSVGIKDYGYIILSDEL